MSQPPEHSVRFTSEVEPPEPMRGLVVPESAVDALGGGPRPWVVISINGHSWRSRIAIMRGRTLIGLSKANRQAAGVDTGEEVVVDVVLDERPREVVEPPDLTQALDAEPPARAAFDRLSYSHKRAHVLAIEGAKRPETRARRIAQAIAKLTGAG
jgi:hypothetical protein